MNSGSSVTVQVILFKWKLLRTDALSWSQWQRCANENLWRKSPQLSLWLDREQHLVNVTQIQSICFHCHFANVSMLYFPFSLLYFAIIWSVMYIFICRRKNKWKINMNVFVWNSFICCLCTQCTKKSIASAFQINSIMCLLQNFKK